MAEAIGMTELSPACVLVEHPAIALPGEFDRVHGFYKTLHPVRARDSMFAREVKHGATTTYCIRDAVIVDGCVYSRKSFDAIRCQKRKAILVGASLDLAEAQLSSDSCSTQYFGDWLMSGLAMELLAEERGMIPLVLGGGPWPSEVQYRNRLNLHAEVVGTTPVHIGSLWLVNDHGLNEGRRRRTQILRQRARHVAPLGDRRVYIERGSLGIERGLTNEIDLREMLAKRGFVVVRPEEIDVGELARILSGAMICVGIEGSALCNATMLMPPGAGVLAIQPPQRFSNGLKLFCDVAGLRFGFVVGDGRSKGFDAPIGRLGDTIDIMEAELD
jgi:hypothetical protein